MIFRLPAWFGLAAAALLCAPAGSALAAVATFNLVPQGSTNITAGETISVQVNLTIDTNAGGLDFFFNEATSAGFTITGVDRSSHPFNDDFAATVSEIISPTGGNNILNPRMDKSLGGEAPLSPGYVGPGTYNLGVYTITSPSLGPGVYNFTIGLADIEIFDDGFVPFDTVNSDTFGVTVNGVPEPSTLLLTSLAALGAAAYRRRRSRAERSTLSQLPDA